MKPSDFESALLSIFEQALVQNARSVALGDNTFPVRVTAKKSLRQVDFRFPPQRPAGPHSPAEAPK